MTIYDFNEAEPSGFDCIPDGTQVPVVFRFIQGDQHDDMHATKDGRGRMVKMEAVVTDGPYAKRKIFCNWMMGTNDPEDEGHKKAVDISKSNIRSVIEAARGIDPKDETPNAIALRKAAVAELDGMECTIVVGIEKGTGSYQDKNVFKRVVPVGRAAPPDGAAPVSGAARPRPTAAKPAAATKQAGAW